MNKNLVLIFIFLSNFQFITGQNIYSALHHDDRLDLRKIKSVKKIVKHRTFFNKNDTEIETSTIILNDSSRVIKEDRFNEKYNRKTRFTITYDSTQTHSLTRRVELTQPYVRNVTTTYYEYDENRFLTKIINKRNNKIYRVTNIINNEKGHPIELKLIENSIPYGKETAEYDYVNNLTKRTVYNELGEVKSISSGKIDFSISDNNDLRNEYGDLLQSKLFKFEYKYDKFGNWKRQKRYMLKNGKWVKNAIFKRTIYYRK
ncbi:hypothetical protein [Polaribacter sp. OB-PA-B3]